jgi:hypothetical protein
MATQLLSEKYADKIDGVLNCYDRILISGNLQPFCYAAGMAGYLRAQGIRLFDYTQFAQPLRDEIRLNAESLAQAHGLTIEFVRKKNFRKEDRVQALLKKRGHAPGLVHIFSAMEPCATYQPWYDQPTGRTLLKYTDGKCLQYYFYFSDSRLGLCYLRVPTWCPFRLQFYCNGHAWLATELSQHGIAHTLHDNAFVHIADYATANRLADQFDPRVLHTQLDQWAAQYCPVGQRLHLTYQWNIWQAEYATDLVFQQRADLQAIYPQLLATLVLAVKPDDIATFLGRKLHGNFQGEVGSRFNVRLLGTRLKHQMQSASLKLYDKFGQILRIETTSTDITFFRHYREIHHRHGTTETRWAPMKKTVYSLTPLRDCLRAANRRYLEFLSDLETPAVGVQSLAQVTETKTEHDHRYKGFNLLAEDDAALLRTLLRGEFAISGMTSRALHALFPAYTTGQISRLVKRLRVHGLLKKVGHHYKYYLTDFGRRIATMALKLREMHIIPALAQSTPA